MLICVYPIEKWTLILKMVERDVFLWNQSIDELWFYKVVESKVFLMKVKNQFINPNKENDFMAPNN